jgi:DNA repair photolyase
MKTYRYALSITSQFYFCGVPFRLDISPKCTQNCLYCFAMSRGGRRTSNDQIADVKQISRKLKKATLKKNYKLDIIGEMLAHRVPIHFGGISDPFSNGVTTTVAKKLLNILNKYNYPIIISTKNTQELLRDEVLELLNKLNYIAVQVSITTNNEKFSRIMEPNVPTPKERIECLEVLADEGIFTIARLQPLFFPWIDEIIHELVPMLGAAKCNHVIVEYLKLPVEKNISLMKDALKAIKWNAYEFYQENGSLLIGREWILPNRLKWNKLRPLIRAIHRFGMTYGAGDYGLNHLGDTDCCCGIDSIKGFSNWFRGNFSNVIRNLKSKYITFDQVKRNWFPTKSIAMYMNSNCRLTEKNTVLNYLRKKWNRPGTSNAPDAFLGISWNGEYDENGNCIYSLEEDSFDEL